MPLSLVPPSVYQTGFIKPVFIKMGDVQLPRDKLKKAGKPMNRN
jgi:hypothetical protein